MSNLRAEDPAAHQTREWPIDWGQSSLEGPPARPSCREAKAQRSKTRAIFWHLQLRRAWPAGLCQPVSADSLRPAAWCAAQPRFRNALMPYFCVCANAPGRCRRGKIVDGSKERCLSRRASFGRSGGIYATKIREKFKF